MKKILTIILSCVLLVGLVGCSEKKTEEEPTKNETTVEEKKEDKKVEETKVNKLDKFKEELNKKGMEVGENELIAYEMVGANNGYKFKVDGQLIEIYEYDKDNLSEEGKKFIKDAEKGTVEILGMKANAKYKNYLMLLRLDEHNKQKEIEEVFDSL